MRLLASDAPALALARLEHAPPGPDTLRLRADAARRMPPGEQADRLRVASAEALARTGRIEATEALAGAEAALRLPGGDAGAARARRLAATAIWLADAPEGAREHARRLVVRSLFADGLVDEAYAALLRWRLDHPQADAASVAEMAALLAEAGRSREALPLVALLAADSPERLLLQARLGVSAPVEVARRIRSSLPARAPGWFWRMAREIGRSGGDPVLVAEAGTRLVAAGETLRDTGARAGGAREPSDRTGQAGVLRGDLQAAAVGAATERQLLTGDDFGWMDDAARLAATDPPRARALFAGLASGGAAASTREHARLQWVISLRESGLGRAALLLFPPPGSAAPTDTLPEDLARQLGALAAAAGEPGMAAAYWRSLPAPPAGGSGEWALTLSRVLSDSGSHEEAVRRWRAATGAGTATADTRLIELAERMTDAGASAQALGLLEGVDAPAALARPLLLARARAAEAEGLQGRPDRAGGSAASARPTVLPPDAAFAQAASGYLAAAAAGPVDALALEARLRAARNLERAGLREAARAELEAVARQSREPVLRDRARRALAGG